MHRRTWLGLCVGAVASGCLGTAGPPKKDIAWIRLVNDRAEASEIAVSIERGDEDVFSGTYRLGTGPEQGTIRVDDPVDEPARYSLYFDVGDGLVHLHPSEFAEAGVRETCLGIRYTLHEEGTTGFEYEPTDGC